MPETKHESYGTNSSAAPKYVVDNGTATVGVPGKKFDGDFKGHPRDSGNSFESRHPMNPGAYFTEFTVRKAFVYVVATLYVIGCGVVSVAEMFIKLPCPENADKTPIEYPNPDYDPSECPHIRQPMLLGLTQLECSFGRRLVMSILMGGVIGWERRQADRPAGIRTMSLVSLGSCLFTINSAFAFRDGPMEWDASRIAAAIPSGVGFLGAGLIFKKSNDAENSMVVHGLTTAASVWLSAAVGIACGGELYFAATFGTCLMMLLLRFGPRGSDMDDDDSHDDDEIDEDDEEEHGTFAEEVGEPANEELELPPGGQSSATMIFRNSDGSQSLPPGLQVPKPQASIDGSTRGEYTVTGESIESHSERTPMLPQQQQQQQSLLQMLAQQAAAPTLGQSKKRDSQASQLSRGRRTPNKSNKIRKRSQANLGSIV